MRPTASRKYDGARKPGDKPAPNPRPHSRLRPPSVSTPRATMLRSLTRSMWPAGRSCASSIHGGEFVLASAGPVLNAPAMGQHRRERLPLPVACRPPTPLVESLAPRGYHAAVLFAAELISFVLWEIAVMRRVVASLSCFLLGLALMSPAQADIGVK